MILFAERVPLSVQAIVISTPEVEPDEEVPAGVEAATINSCSKEEDVDVGVLSLKVGIAQPSAIKST